MVNDDSKRCCDLVMKGGITSGVLFPPAIKEIAKRFVFVGIGGASAGAIAAAMAAAAEYRRRQHKDMVGFDRLEETACTMADPDNLRELFRPDAATRKLYNFAMKAKGFCGASFCGQAGIIAQAVPMLLSIRRQLGKVVDNGYGLCSGMAHGNHPPPGRQKPITGWMTDTIDEIAGLDRDAPLLFKDLYFAELPPGVSRAPGDPWARSIDLRAVTTCLSFNRPFVLPFEGNLFAFDPDEWARLFPAKVVNYLIRAGERIHSPELKREGKLPLPSREKMPVVVAARMSLSFPGMFSMIPLYAVNYHAGNDSCVKKPLQKVWFSDGGITSNLPIHFFDSLLPNWPTLAINLQYYEKDKGPGRASIGDDLVYMISGREHGADDLWDDFGAKPSPFSDLAGWLGAIFNSARNWRDNSYLKLPGYRDRVVEVWLNQEEGGLNLGMEEDVVEGLMNRGEIAGRKLVERFADLPADKPLSWEGHRWTRLRSAMAGLAVTLKSFWYAAENPMPGDLTRKEMLDNGTTCASYKFSSNAQLEEAREAIDRLLAYIKKNLPREVEDLERIQEECATYKEFKEELERIREQPFHGGPNPKIDVNSRAPM